MFNKEQLAG